MVKFLEFYKTCYLKKKTLPKDVETLILGSSHGEYAWVPQKNEYNLCFSSQDLYYSYSLYHCYAKKCRSLKKVILFFSVFSPGFELEKCSEKERCMIYDAVFNIPPKNCFYDKNPYKKFSLKFKMFVRFFKKRRFVSKYRGECLDITGCKFEMMNLKKLKIRVLKALKYNMQNQVNYEYIKKMIIETTKNKQQLIIILSPVHSKYKQLVDTKINFKCESTLFKSELCQIIDGYRLNCVSDDDFWDFEHLKPNGARKFTTKIREKINK